MQQLMLTIKRLPLLIALICCLEVLIYLWSLWTSTFNTSNFFAIEPEFVFDKSARIAGRISTILILIPLIMVGYSGLKKIYSDNKKKDAFRILITLFTINHLIHFLFVFLRFQSHATPLSIGENLHGFITFISIILIPIILWTNRNLNKVLYFSVVLYLFNISYFINKTFMGKVGPDRPAYHNQFGVVVITLACLYIIYKVYVEHKRSSQANYLNNT